MGAGITLIPAPDATGGGGALFPSSRDGEVSGAAVGLGAGASGGETGMSSASGGAGQAVITGAAPKAGRGGDGGNGGGVIDVDLSG